MVESGGSPLSASIAYELTFSLLPFIVFHPKERKALLTITSIAFVFISCVQFRINLLEMSHGSIDFLKYGIIKDFSIISGSLITYFFLWVISNYSFQAEKKQLQFIEEAQQKNNKLKQSQEVLKNSLKSLDESKVKEKNQLWITEGAAMVGKIIRSNLKGSEMHGEGGQSVSMLFHL